MARIAHLYRSLFPLFYDCPRKQTWSEDIEARLEFAIAKGRDMGFIRKGSFIVFVTGWHPGTSSTNTVRVLEVREDTILGTNPNEIKF